jgi:hypothetical protein
VQGAVLSSTLSSATLRDDWGIEPVAGMLYVTTRAISSRVNANYDGWPASELEKAYRSFVGRGIYVEHNNWDPSRSRGVIMGVKLHKSKLASGEPDYWVELLEEIDAQNFPKLAQAVMSGELKSVSMGADVGFTICSVCTNRAADPSEYCEHIAYQKGQTIVTGGQKRLAWEDCYDINFFEISHVFDPADESADVIGKYLHTGSRSASVVRPLRGREENLENYYGRLQKAASKQAAGEQRVPSPVETLRDDSEDIDELSPSEMVAPNLALDLETLNEFRDYIDQVEEQLKQEADEDEEAEDDGMSEEEAEVEPVTQDEDQSEAGDQPGDSEENMADEDLDMSDDSMDEDMSDDMSEDMDDTMDDDMEDDMDDDFDPNDISMDDDMNDDMEDDEEDLEEESDEVEEEADDIEAEVEDDESEDEEEDDDSDEEEDDEDDDKGTHIHLHNSNRRSAMNRFQQMRTMKRRAGDLNVDYDQTSTMNTDGEYDTDDSEMVDAPASIAANDQVDADASEDVTMLDQTTVKGNPGQSEVTVARKRKANMKRKAEEMAEEMEDEDMSEEDMKAEDMKEARRRRANMKRKAEDISSTDVPSLDANPATWPDTMAADATTDVMTPVDQGNQLALADRPDDVNDGSEAGFSQDNPPSAATSPSDLTYEAAKKAARKQILAAMEVYDLKESLGMVENTRRTAEIAKLEKLHPQALNGMRMVLQEVAQGRTASRRVSTAGTRFPGMGRSNRVLARTDLDPVDDSLITL